MDTNWEGSSRFLSHNRISEGTLAHTFRVVELQGRIPVERFEDLGKSSEYLTHFSKPPALARSKNSAVVMFFNSRKYCRLPQPHFINHTSINLPHYIFVPTQCMSYLREGMGKRKALFFTINL